MKIKMINCNEKKIDSDQNDEWYWKIVGSQARNKIIICELSLGIFFNIDL